MNEKLQNGFVALHTAREEIANAITHGIGAAAAIVGTVILIVLASLEMDVYRIVSVSIYGGSLILLYMASTLYHAFHRPTVRHRVRRFLHICDHVCIFLLIAGSYTPILLVKMRGDGGWTLLIIIWTIALVGSFIKLFYTGQYNKITTAAYVMMGWLVVFVLGGVIRTMGTEGFAWLLAGGISYTLGVIPYLWEKLPYNHAIWHLFVIGGSVCHFLCILWYVLPMA